MLYDVVNPLEWMPEARPLIESNWAETGLSFRFDPHLDAYRAMVDAGMMFAIRAHEDGQTFGYCNVYICPHQHNKSVVTAGNDALFVAHEKRGTTLATRLIEAAEGEARKRGAVMFTWHCLAGTGLAAMFEARGYRPLDTVVVKDL